MKDFDTAREQRATQDRDFKIGGEFFRARSSVRPEALIAYERMDESTTITDTMGIIDELMVAFIEPVDEAHERYRALRAREEDPLSVDDLKDLVKWLMEVQTGRPTEQPGDSSAGLGSTGTNSTDTSSSADSPEA